MPGKPPRRPPPRDALGDLHIAGENPQQATARHLEALRAAIDQLRQGSVNPTVNRLTFNPISPVTTVNSSVYVDPDDGELYYRDPDGTVSQVSNQSTGGGGSSDTYGSRYAVAAAELLLGITGTPIDFTNGRGVGSAAGACSFFARMPTLRQGDRIRSVTGTFSTGVGPGTTSITLKRRSGTGLAPSTVATASSAASGAPITVPISGLTETIAAGTSYVLEVATARSQDALETIVVEYDRP